MLLGRVECVNFLVSWWTTTVSWFDTDRHAWEDVGAIPTWTVLLVAFDCIAWPPNLLALKFHIVQMKADCKIQTLLQVLLQGSSRKDQFHFGNVSSCWNFPLGFAI